MSLTDVLDIVQARTGCRRDDAILAAAEAYTVMPFEPDDDARHDLLLRLILAGVAMPTADA